MKVIQQDWSKIRNQLWNKKQRRNKAKCSEIDIWLKFGKMHWTDTEVFSSSSNRLFFHGKLQTIDMLLNLHIYPRSNNCIFSLILSNKAWHYDHSEKIATLLCLCFKTMKHHLLWFVSCCLLNMVVAQLLLLCMLHCEPNTSQALDKWKCIGSIWQIADIIEMDLELVWPVTVKQPFSHMEEANV